MRFTFHPRFTAVKPQDRLAKILENVRATSRAVQSSEMARNFGLSVQDNFTEIQARVLPHPALGYKALVHDGTTVKEEVQPVQPREGKWDMGGRGPGKGKIFVDGKSLMR